MYLLACQVRVTVGDSGLCCCDTYFQRQLTFLCIESAKTAYRELRISSIRHCLSVDATKTLVVFLCYVTAGLLQRNPSGLLVIKTGTRFSASAYALLAFDLSKNQLQTFLHLFLFCTGSGLQHLADILKIDVPSLQLRSSSDSRMFQTPSVQTKSFGQRPFSYDGPPVCNKLPHNIRHASCITFFKAAR